MSLEFRTLTCNSEGCHIIYQVLEPVAKRWEETHETFYCPHGHTQWYPGKTDKQKLSERDQEIIRLGKERERIQAERNKLKRELEICLTPKRKKATKK